jgi:hypothetical protein
MYCLFETLALTILDFVSSYKLFSLFENTNKLIPPLEIARGLTFVIQSDNKSAQNLFAWKLFPTNKIPRTELKGNRLLQIYVILSMLSVK